MYYPNLNNSFGINFTDETLLYNVSFESNYTGTLINYTGINSTIDIFNYSFTDYGVMNFTGRWIGYDTSGNGNATDILTYSIFINNTQPNITLYLNRTSKNKTYQNRTIANLTSNITNSFRMDINISTNLTDWSPEPSGSIEVYNTTNLTSPDGLYNITSYTITNINYSTVNNITYWLRIDGTSPQYYNLTVKPDSNTPFIRYTVHYFNSTWIDNIGLNEIIFEFNGVNYSYLNNEMVNDTSYINNTFIVNRTIPVVGSYTYKW